MLALLAAASLQAAAPAQTCQAALGPLYEGIEESALPNRIDGATIAGRDALVALRAARGDALLTITGGNFARADLHGARLHNFCFVETDLSGANLSGAEARGIGFVRANLEGANLSGAHLAQVLFRQANLKDGDASGADLAGGRMDGGWDASVENLKFDRASLRGFRFDCGITIDDGCAMDGGMSLRGADLYGAFLSSYLGLTDWRGAVVNRTEISLTQIEELDTTRIEGPVLLRGGEAVVELSPAELARLRPYVARADEAADPSFSCARAASMAERLICGPEGGTLRARDRELASLYRQAGAAGSAGQVEWLRERDRCADIFCIGEAYERRRAILVGRIGPPAWARPGAAALFVAPQVTVYGAIRSDPLFARLLPVIIGGAWSRAVVRVNADGTIGVSGDAIGANAHSCSLGGEMLRFDRRTGYYSGPQESGADVPLPWRNRPMPVLLLWDDSAIVFEGGRSGEGGERDPRPSEYASCGARARFGQMERMPVDAAEIARLEEGMEQ